MSKLPCWSSQAHTNILAVYQGAESVSLALLYDGEPLRLEGWGGKTVINIADGNYVWQGKTTKDKSGMRSSSTSQEGNKIATKDHCKSDRVRTAWEGRGQESMHVCSIVGKASQTTTPFHHMVRYTCILYIGNCLQLNELTAESDPQACRARCSLRHRSHHRSAGLWFKLHVKSTSVCASLYPDIDFRC